jgi:hypothetical protein
MSDRQAESRKKNFPFLISHFSFVIGKQKTENRKQEAEGTRQ